MAERSAENGAPQRVGAGRKAIAWAVHLYTASGGLIGMLALMAAAEGETREAFLYLGAAAIIDATDGILARLGRVGKVLPWFSGAQLDNAIDVFTFIWVPIFIIGQEELLPHPAWLAVPILAALYAYGQVNMKTADNFFLGFPSYWNIVALYLFWLQPSPVGAVLWVTIPALLSFIPTRYLYPSHGGVLWKTTWTLGIIWAALLLYLLLHEPTPRDLVLASLYFPVYYVAASFYTDIKIRRRHRRRMQSSEGGA